MKNLLLVLTLVLSGCLSQRARDEGLMPAMRLAWGTEQAGVKSDLLRGFSAMEIPESSPLWGEMQGLEEALHTGLRADLRQVNWPALLPIAEAGIHDRIESGEMNELVAERLFERLHNFSVGFGMAIAKFIPSRVPKDKRHWVTGYGPVTDEAAIAVVRTYGRTNQEFAGLGAR